MANIISNKNIVFYLPQGSMNEATDYYVKLIEQAFTDKKHQVSRITDSKKVSDHDVVVTIRPGDQLVVSKNKTNVLINWFQGIGPEEYLMLHGHTMKAKLVYHFLNWQEKKSLIKSNFCIFVSQAMLKHYENKYNLKLSQKSIVIPCYNKQLQQNLFEVDEKYKKLKFVYAGGLFSWQCIDQTLLLFKEINALDPTASLDLLTNDKAKAMALLQKYQLLNVNIDHVPLEHLQGRLSEYKYAFLIRENHVVNKVSTPTKMNSYLAAGLLPIYTDVIDSFEAFLPPSKNFIKLANPINYKDVAKQIIEHHSLEIDTKLLFAEYKTIFESYYNDEAHKTIVISEIIDRIK